MYLVTPLVRKTDYSGQEKVWMKSENENEKDFWKRAKEIDFIEKEIKGVKRSKVNIRRHGSHREA